MCQTRFIQVFGSVALLVVGFLGSGRAAEMLTPSNVTVEKIALERELESKSQRYIDAILGQNKAQIIFVVMDITPSVSEKIEMISGKKQETAFSWRDPKSGQAILPGFHADSPPLSSASGAQYSRIATMGGFIQKITGILLVDHRVPEESVSNLRESLFTILALNAERGDSLQLVRGTIPTPQMGETPWWTPAHWAITLGAAVILIIVLALKTGRASTVNEKRSSSLPGETDGFQRVGTTANRGGQNSPRQGAEKNGPNPMLEMADPTAVLGDLDVSTALAIRAFLATHPPQKAAAMLSLLHPETSAKVLELMEPSARFELFKSLNRNFTLSKEDRTTLAPAMAEFVRFFVQGPHLLVDMIESAPESAQNIVIADLEKTDPGLWAAVQAAMIKPDDLWALPDDQWATLAAELPIEDLAVALQEAPPAVRDQRAAALPGDVAALVAQHLKLAGAPSPIQTVRARRKLLAAARALQQTGKITLTRVVRA